MFSDHQPCFRDLIEALRYINLGNINKIFYIIYILHVISSETEKQKTLYELMKWVMRDLHDDNYTFPSILQVEKTSRYMYAEAVRFMIRSLMQNMLVARAKTSFLSQSYYMYVRSVLVRTGNVFFCFCYTAAVLWDFPTWKHLFALIFFSFP